MLKFNSNTAPCFKIAATALAVTLKEFFGDKIAGYSFTDCHIGYGKEQDSLLRYKIAYHIGTNDSMAGLNRSFPLQTLIESLEKPTLSNDIQIHFSYPEGMLSITENDNGEYSVVHLPNNFSVVEPEDVEVVACKEWPLPTNAELQDVAIAELDKPAIKFEGRWLNDNSETKCTQMVAEMPTTLPPTMTHSYTEGMYPRFEDKQANLVIARHQEGITINALEYILDNDNLPKRFISETDVKNFLNAWDIPLESVMIRTMNADGSTSPFEGALPTEVIVEEAGRIGLAVARVCDPIADAKVNDVKLVDGVVQVDVDMTSPAITEEIEVAFTAVGQDPAKVEEMRKHIEHISIETTVNK